jgi:RNA polymerase sigma-70 factor (ECF subfamily)
MADDLAQDAMMRGWAARASFTPGTNFRAWMFMILRNQFCTTFRKNKLMTSWDPEVAERVLVEAPAQLDAIHVADVERALQQLPAEQREVLLMIGANGVSYEEAAEVIGCALGTVKSRLARGRKALALLIDGPGGNALFDKVACLFGPKSDGVDLSPSQRRDLWDRFYTAAPRPRTPFEASYSDRKLRSRASRSGSGSTRRPS